MNMSDFINRLKNSSAAEFWLKTKEYFLKFKFMISISVIVFVCLSAVFAGLYNKYIDTSNPSYKESTTNDKVVAAEKIKVYITGAVKNPGVYTLTDEHRVDDAIKSAGGATENADLEKINLSIRLKDEQYINVPDKSETIKSEKTVSKPKNSAAAKPFSGVININTASAAELDTLPGIGSTIANRIIEYRNNVGDFTDKRDIMNIEGIGPSLYEQIQNYITI